MTFVKKTKPVTKNTWKYLNFLPTFLREKVVRSQFEIKYDLSADYVFKQAETEDEIQDALNIVYESYSKLGYIDERPEKIHFNTFLCLPTTTILIIKYKEEVIGTMSIVLDSACGLPAEATWNLSKIRAKTNRIAEISSFSIKRSHKSSKGHIFLMLCKLMLDFCVKVLKTDGIIMAATQEVEALYTDLLLFEKVVGKTGQEHKLVKGNKSTCCFLDLVTLESRYRKTYKGCKPSRNIHHFFCEFESPNFIMPKEQLSIHGTLLKKNEAMIHILEKFPMLKQSFSTADRLALANLDPSSSIGNVINFDRSLTSRKRPRISIRNIHGYLYSAHSSHMIEALITDVSSLGYGLKLQKDFERFELKDKFVLIFETNGEALTIHGQLQWKSGLSSGFLVLEKSRKEWEKFASLVFNEIGMTIHNMEEEIKKAA
jgi:hypothetical protein